MSYEYLDDIATGDVAFRASGNTFGEMCAAAVDATLQVMVAPGRVAPAEVRSMEVRAESEEMLVFQLLQELIFHKDADGFIFRVRKAVARQEEGEWVIRFEAAGETLDAKKHRPQTDVKAVTLHRFQVVQVNGIWQTTVVLDI